MQLLCAGSTAFMNSASELVCGVMKVRLPSGRLHIFVEITFITITLCWDWMCR